MKTSEDRTLYVRTPGNVKSLRAEKWASERRSVRDAICPIFWGWKGRRRSSEGEERGPKSGYSNSLRPGLAQRERGSH